jgi:hypothetical protein
MKVFLDDLRTIDMVYSEFDSNEWVIVRDFHQFVNYINKYGIPEFVSFDHDLGFEHTRFFFNNGGHENPPDPIDGDFKEKTGYDAAKWLVEYCINNDKKIPKWFVHSANPVGNRNIREYLKNAEKYISK